MPIQTPQWTDFLLCPVCENSFDLKVRLPISLACGHSVCKTCLANLQRNVCPFDQSTVGIALEKLPVNTALALLIDGEAPLNNFRLKSSQHPEAENYNVAMTYLEQLSTFLRPSNTVSLSRPMQRKLVALINCQLLEAEGRARTIRAERSLGERSVTELILQHQNPSQLSANLWAAVRTRGCQFLGPAMQEEVLKLVLLALEDGSALSRKVLVMFVVQRLEPHYAQASKTSIGHVVQLLYRASCFIVTKRDGDSSLMQLKEEFRTYEALRREHDAQIVQVATEAGLRIAPDQWSSLLYGDTNHKSHMQSIIDKLQTPQSFAQSVQELVIALQRTNDPGKLSSLRPHLDLLSSFDPSSDCSDWKLVRDGLHACCQVVAGLVKFISNHSQRRPGVEGNGNTGGVAHGRYKTTMCRDLSTHNSCPRGKHCTFAHSQAEMEQHRQKRSRYPTMSSDRDGHSLSLNGSVSPPHPIISLQTRPSRMEPSMTPVAQVLPLPREMITELQPTMLPVLQAPPSQNGQPPAALFDGTSFTPIPMMQAMPPPPPPDLMPALMPVVDSSLLSPPIQLHYSSLFPPAVDQVYQSQQYQEHLGELQRQSAAQAKTMHDLATKSLSALKSRKDEIIDSLEDLVGKDETLKISQVTSERASLQNLPDERGGYSMWNSNQYLPFQPMTPFFEDDSERPVAVATGSGGSGRPEDELIPFSDTPQISRFGPISRRSIICSQPAPKQSQAVIADETHPTSAVRHTKSMSRPAPPSAPVAASLLHQNGTRTTLQPVAVGINGEIGYIALPETQVMVGAAVAAAAADINMQHLHQPIQVGPPVQHPMGPPPPPAQQQQQAMNDMDSYHPSAMMSETDRMRQHLDLLQMQLSSLNMARLAGLPPPNLYPDMGMSCTNSNKEKDQLTSELQLIENSIQDREREIKINHQLSGEAATASVS